MDSNSILWFLVLFIVISLLKDLLDYLGIIREIQRKINNYFLKKRLAKKKIN